MTEKVTIAEAFDSGATRGASAGIFLLGIGTIALSTVGAFVTSKQAMKLAKKVFQ